MSGNLIAAVRERVGSHRKRKAGFLTIGSRRINGKKVPIEVTRHRVCVPGLSAALSGMKVAFAADFHFSYIHPARRVRAAVDKIMELDADVILLGGDYLTRARHNFDAAIAELSRLDAPRGVWAVPGNHDYESGVGDLGKAIAHTHIKSIANRGFALRPTRRDDGEGKDSDCLWVGGLDDLWHGSPDPEGATSGAPEGAPRVLVCHNPHTVDLLPPRSAELILAGHTHGWQVYIPGVSRAFIRKEKARYRHGFYHTHAGLMYVTSGVGHSHVPVRFRSSSEVVLFELVRD